MISFPPKKASGSSATGRSTRRSNRTAHALQSGQLRYGTETCRLPANRDALWARLDTPLSWLGWLRTVLYKPPEITLIVSDGPGREQRFRLVARASCSARCSSTPPT